MGNAFAVADPPHQIDKPLVTSALEKLGIERVVRGHVALEHGTGGNWQACFLAMCYGGFGRLMQLINAAEDPLAAAGRALGISPAETYAVMDAYDHCRLAFQALVEEWLELNCVAPVPA